MFEILLVQVSFLKRNFITCEKYVQVPTSTFLCIFAMILYDPIPCSIPRSSNKSVHVFAL